MHFIYRREEIEKAATQFALPEQDGDRELWQTAFHFFILVAILVSANWGKPDTTSGFWYMIYRDKWLITGFWSILLMFSLIYVLKLNRNIIFSCGLAIAALTVIFKGNPIVPFAISVIVLCFILYFNAGEPQEWLSSSWDSAKQIMPLLGAGVLVAGFSLGTPEGGQGIIPSG